MKIVHALSEVRLAHGGVVRAVLDLCAALARAEHEVTLLTFDDTDVPPSWKRGGALVPRCIRLDWPERAKPIRRYRKADLLRAEGAIAGARVLHLHVPWESTNLQLARLAEARRVPYVLSIHGMLDDWTIAQGKVWLKRAYLALAGRRLLERAAAVLCTAEAERAQASKWFTNPRTEVLPLVFDLSPFRRTGHADAAADLLARIPGEGPLALFLSRLHPKKGLGVALESAARLWGEGLAFRFAVAGGPDRHAPDYPAQMRALADRLGIAGRVAMLGLVVDDAKVALLRASRCLVLPTSQENWGFVPLEALAAGRPVVTTKGVDIWPELERSGGALIVEPTADGVAGAMRALVTDGVLADGMGAAGRDWVMRELEAGAVVRRYEALYRSLGDS